MEKLFQSVGDQVGSFRFRYVNMSTPGWTMRRQRFLVLKPFCFCNWIIHPAIKKLPVHVCLSCLSEPCTFSWPASCPPAHLVSSPVSFSYYFSNPYIFTSYLNVFQLPLTDLPLNHPPPSIAALFLLSLSIFDFHQTESRLSPRGLPFILFLLMTISHFPSVYPDPLLYSPSRSPSFSSPPFWS